MKGLSTRRALFCAFAVAVAMASALASINLARADGNYSNSTTVSNATHMGPGLGSAKEPGYWNVAPAGVNQAQARGPMSFHTSDQQPAQQHAVTRMGPGPWSVKAPGIHNSF